MVQGKVDGGLVNVACVLRSGGDYTADYVRRLQEGVGKYLHRQHRFICFSDCDVPCERVPLEFDWPKWWPKLELFSPSFEGDLFYLDLDSIPVGPLDDLASIGKLAIMRDVYRPRGLQSAVMFIPESEKAAVWEAFNVSPKTYISAFQRGGDQAFLETLWLDSAIRFQDALPGQIVSYKKDVLPRRTIPADARIVAFHGRPRPHQVGWLQ